MKPYILSLTGLLLLTSCGRNTEPSASVQGKVEREQIAVVGKIAGRIATLNVQEGDVVHRGDTLAILDIPEVAAKKAQAQGAVTSAEAQYQMSTHGATANQLKQLHAKKMALQEQYAYAEKSLKRLGVMVKDSLIPQQQYDEVYAKHQGAQAQLSAVAAEIADVQHGVRMEQQQMALGQQDRALGALQEVAVAEQERYIIAPQDMRIENITLHTGELALPGYTLFTGSLQHTTYFRFTIPEHQLKQYTLGAAVTIKIPYLDQQTIKGTVQQVKPIGAYANIATAYPDYDMQESLYELIIQPQDSAKAASLYRKTTVILAP